MKRRQLLAASGALIAAPAVVRAQDAWPNRPIRLVVGFPPGGSVDTIARILQPKLGELLGRPIIIDNKGGAAGSIGAGEVARSAPDGYTWFLAYDTQATNESVMRLPFRTMEAFAPVSLVASGPLCLVVHKDTAFRTFADFVAAAKRAPGDINYATSGVGGLAHVATVLLSQQGGFQVTHVPYRGAGPAVQDAIAGHVPAFMSNVVVIKEHMQSGILRPLGVTTATESRHVPGVQSFAQMGFPTFQAPTWWAMLGPARTPAPILTRMHQALVQTLNDPGVKSRIEEQGADVITTSPADCAAFLRSEIEKWGRVIREANIRADS